MNLAKLTSESYARGFYRKPRIDFETLAKYSKGIIALSGCINGVASQYLLYSDYEKAREVTAKFLDIFGRENYYIEVQNHFMAADKKVIPGLVKLAREFGLKIVATNDSHYVYKKDASAHDAMLCINTGSLVSDENRMRYPNNEFYIKSREEMEILFPDLPEALDNTVELAERVDIKIPIGENHYPRYEQPADIKYDRDEANFNRILDLYVTKKNEVLKQNGKEADFALSDGTRRELMKNGLLLFDLSKKGMMKRYGVDYDHPEAYVPKPGEAADRAQMLCDKLDYELSIIVGAGFVDYFLIVYEFINWAREHGIPVGPGLRKRRGLHDSLPDKNNGHRTHTLQPALRENALARTRLPAGLRRRLLRAPKAARDRARARKVRRRQGRQHRHLRQARRKGRRARPRAGERNPLRPRQTP